MGSGVAAPAHLLPAFSEIAETGPFSRRQS